MTSYELGERPPQDSLKELAKLVLAEAELTGQATVQYNALEIEVSILEMERQYGKT